MNLEQSSRWGRALGAFLVAVAWCMAVWLAFSAYDSRRDAHDLLTHGQHGHALVKRVFPHQRHWLPGADEDTALITFVSTRAEQVDAWLPLTHAEADRLRYSGPGAPLDILYMPQHPDRVATLHPVSHAVALFADALLFALIGLAGGIGFWRRFRKISL